jgi:dTMP kinase
LSIGKGKFVVIEGIDGAGTTTQAKLLVDYLNSIQKNAVLTAEPTSGEIGKLIRRFLQKEIFFDEKTLALLFAADRTDHIEKIITPVIEQGNIVVTDRYFLSSLAYQSTGAETTFIENVNFYHVLPDITFLIDIDPEISLGRKTQSNEFYEKMDLQKRIRKNYLWAYEKYKEAHNIKLIDGTLGIEEIHRQIVQGLD